MWLLTRYGFYSIACASKSDGALDPDTLMIRARCKSHLQKLQSRFPAIAGAEILAWPNRDYRYRIIVPKTLWVDIVAELTCEQTWSNFKHEAARFQAKPGGDYAGALHEVWSTMYRLRQSEAKT